MKENKLIKAFWNNTKKKDDARIATLEEPTFDEATLDINYVGDGNPMHTLNVYRPIGAEGKLPVIFDIHGGGWYYGDKELNSYYCRSLVRYGFAVVDISYRLAPEADIKGMLQDTFAAMAHVSAHADEFGLDMDKFFVTGDSAGGHIAGLVANIVKSAELQEYYSVTPSADIKAVCLTCPASDPLALFPVPKCLMKFYYNALLGKGYLKNGAADKASFTSTLQKDICPCYVISCYGDFLKSSAKATYEVLKAQGTKCELFFLDAPMNAEHKLEHVFNILYWNWEEAEAANKGMCAFFMSCV